MDAGCSSNTCSHDSWDLHLPKHVEPLAFCIFRNCAVRRSCTPMLLPRASCRHPHRIMLQTMFRPCKPTVPSTLAKRISASTSGTETRQQCSGRLRVSREPLSTRLRLSNIAQPISSSVSVSYIHLRFVYPGSLRPTTVALEYSPGEEPYKLKNLRASTIHTWYTRGIPVVGVFSFIRCIKLRLIQMEVC